MTIIATFIVGLLFGTGIIVSGMANPAKVLNFFDIAGHWDPSLMFVMGGALTVTLIGYRLVWRASRPLLTDTFQHPAASRIDARLLSGAAIFGLGWGLVGFCPGAALPVLAVGGENVVTFVGGLVAGIVAVKLVGAGVDKGPREPAAHPSA